MFIQHNVMIKEYVILRNLFPLKESLTLKINSIVSFFLVLHTDRLIPLSDLSQYLPTLQNGKTF